MTSAMSDYAITIFPLLNVIGGGCTAIALEHPGCRANGGTPQEALENIYDVSQCWMEAAQKMGRDVPLPKKLAA